MAEEFNFRQCEAVVRRRSLWVNNCTRSVTKLVRTTRTGELPLDVVAKSKFTQRLR